MKCTYRHENLRCPSGEVQGLFVAPDLNKAPVSIQESEGTIRFTLQTVATRGKILSALHTKITLKLPATYFKLTKRK
jgi:hypothetical protein